MTKTDLRALSECLRAQDEGIPADEPTPSRAAADLCEKLAELEPAAYDVRTFGRTNRFVKRIDVADELAGKLREDLPSADVEIRALHNLTGIIDHE